MLKRKAILRSLALAFILAVGFAALLVMFIGWLGSVWEQWRGRSYVIESSGVGDDGKPLIGRCVVDRGRQHDTYFTLDRIELPASTENGTRATGAALMMPREREFGEFPLDVSDRIRLFSRDYPKREFWYFVHDGQRAGHGYFVGYDTESKLRVGFIGRRGYCSEQPARENWFAFDGLALASRLSSPCEFFPAGLSSSGYGYVSARRLPFRKNLHDCRRSTAASRLARAVGRDSD